MSDLTEAIALTQMGPNGGEYPIGFPTTRVALSALAAFLSDRGAMLRVVDGELELVRAQTADVGYRTKYGGIVCEHNTLHGDTEVPTYVLTPLEDDRDDTSPKLDAMIPAFDALRQVLTPTTDRDDT